MRTSDSIKELATALSKAQGAMAGAKKESDNPAFGSKYADLASIVDAIKKPLADNGLSYVQAPCTNDKDEVGCETRLMHSSGEWIHAESYFMPVAKANAHGFGSILTYSRRYALAAVCGIAPEDDDANAGVAAKPARQKEVADGPPRTMKSAEFIAHCTAMASATKAEALQQAFTKAILDARAIGDAEAERSFIEKKTMLKEELTRVMQMELGSQP